MMKGFKSTLITSLLGGASALAPLIPGLHVPAAVAVILIALGAVLSNLGSILAHVGASQTCTIADAEAVSQTVQAAVKGVEEAK